MSPLRLLICSLLAVTIQAAPGKQPEQALIKALSWQTGSLKRLGGSHAAVKAAIQAGYLKPRPAARADYTDYYLARPGSTLFGHSIVALEEEYMAAYVGCCVSPGLSLTLKLKGSDQALRDFADHNACEYTPEVNPAEALRAVGVRARFPAGRYARLDCRERYAERAMPN